MIQVMELLLICLYSFIASVYVRMYLHMYLCLCLLMLVPWNSLLEVVMTKEFAFASVSTFHPCLLLLFVNTGRHVHMHVAGRLMECVVSCSARWSYLKRLKVIPSLSTLSSPFSLDDQTTSGRYIYI